MKGLGNSAGWFEGYLWASAFGATYQPGEVGKSSGPSEPQFISSVKYLALAKVTLWL